MAHLAPGGIVDPNDRTPVPAGANSALALLLLINLFNYIDRQVLSSVLPRLKLDGTIFRADDPDIQFKLGLLSSAFLVAYMIFSPIVGALDSRGYRRWMILGLGVTVWSLASGGSGFATTYWILFATRCLVGVGEGAYGPVASAMLADIYPARMRGTVLAIFNMAIPVGSAIGFVIGGVVSDIFNDWRHAFWVTFAGLGLGLVCFLKKELPRPKAAQGTVPASYFDVLGMLAKNKSFVFCCVGMTAITFAIGGIAVWMPEYAFQRETRFAMTADALESLANPPADALRQPLPAELIAKLTPTADGEVRTYPEFRKRLKPVLSETESKLYLASIFDVATAPGSPSLGKINTIFGGILIVGGLSATLIATWVGEKLRTRVRGGYFYVIGIGALLAVPAYLGLLYAPFPWAWLCAFFAIVGLFFHVGPGFTILANVVAPEIRATAFAINILVIHALGDVISPPIIGAVADAYDLQTAFLWLTGTMVLGGIVWIIGARFLEADTQAAEAALVQAQGN